MREELIRENEEIEKRLEHWQDGFKVVREIAPRIDKALRVAKWR